MHIFQKKIFMWELRGNVGVHFFLKAGETTRTIAGLVSITPEWGFLQMGIRFRGFDMSKKLVESIEAFNDRRSVPHPQWKCCDFFLGKIDIKSLSGFLGALGAPQK